jgi:isoleucyl-tRNA synthetase
MYTLSPRSQERRSTQTAMFVMCDGLARLLAPILPVTADDLWRHMPGERGESVHLEDFPAVSHLANQELLGTWERLLAVRETVNVALEDKRKEKLIGNALSARVVITARGPVARLLETHQQQLPMLFNVSDVALHLGPDAEGDEVHVVVERAPGVKCARCWRFVSRVRSEPEWEGICDRCRGALSAAS